NAFDFGALDRERFCGRSESQCAFSSGRDEGIEYAAIFEIHNGHAEIGRHHGAWVEDVLQKIIEVVTAAARQMGACFAALAIKRVARRARGIEQDSALAFVSFG